MDTGHGANIANLAVLAVDDHEINRDFIRAALTGKVASLELAGSGFEAVRHCQNAHFDIVLMDLHMPDMDGLSAWRRICSQAGDKLTTRVIALTADSRSEECERLRNAGFHGFLNKPVPPKLLMRTIGRVAAGRDGFTEIRDPAEQRALLLDDARAARASGSPKRARQMRAALAHEFDERRADLDRALAEGRFGDAAELLHQWTGASGYAGATRMEQASAALEQVLRRDLDSSPGTLYLDLLRTLESTRQSIVAADPNRAVLPDENRETS
ncbi:MAG: response regulator [Wenzhouxiangellaceae bacterium]